MSEGDHKDEAPRPVEELRRRLRPYQREALDALAAGPKSLDLAMMDAGRRRMREMQASGRAPGSPLAEGAPESEIVTLTYADLRKPR